MLVIWYNVRMIAFSRSRNVSKLERIEHLPLIPFKPNPTVKYPEYVPLEALTSVKVVSKEDFEKNHQVPAPIYDVVEVEPVDMSKKETLADYYTHFEPNQNGKQSLAPTDFAQITSDQVSKPGVRVA